MTQQSENPISINILEPICEPCQKSTPSLELSSYTNGSNQTVPNYPTEEPPASAVSVSVESVPTLEPPSQLANQGGISAGWQTDKKITGLWSNCPDQRNAWMYVDGLGWRKLADNSDSAIMAFNIIAAHAKVTGKGAYFYEGNDGKVNTLYVW